jgi:hypothetical protein
MSHGTDLAAGGGGGSMTRAVTPVEIVAHRGANREAPENTLPAFRRRQSRLSIICEHHDEAKQYLAQDALRDPVAFE